MAFRMHEYDDGLTGLAAFCDTCGEQITEHTEHGFVIWDPNNVGDWLVVHQSRCDPGGSGRSQYSHSMGLEAEIVYLANSAGVDLDKARAYVGTLDSIG